MEIRPDDCILEIGCGHGVAVTYIGDLLQTGVILAIDRSAKMIEAARARNAGPVCGGRAKFIVADFDEFDPGPLRFDKILAVRVGVFHHERARASARASAWLKPGGRLVIEYDEPAT